MIVSHSPPPNILSSQAGLTHREIALLGNPDPGMGPPSRVKIVTYRCPTLLLPALISQWFANRSTDLGCQQHSVLVPRYPRCSSRHDSSSDKRQFIFLTPRYPCFFPEALLMALVSLRRTNCRQGSGATSNATSSHSASQLPLTRPMSILYNLLMNASAPRHTYIHLKWRQ